MTPPRISVLLPCFNDGLWLDDAVASVQAQTVQDFEIIIVDDGSTDPATVRKLDRFAAPHSRVLRTANRGLPAARNFAAAHATGEILCALDADDLLAPSWFEKGLAVLDGSPELGFVSHWLEAFGDEEWVWRPERCDLAALLDHNTVNGAALVRRPVFDAVGGYDETMRQGCEDWDFWLRVVSRGFAGRIVPEVLFRYRRRAGSMSRTMVTDAGYPRPFETLLDRHLPEYRRHVVELLAAKEAEAMQVKTEILNLQRDQVTVLEPGLARAAEQDAAIAAKTARHARLAAMEAENVELKVERDSIAAERDAARADHVRALQEAERRFEAHIQDLGREAARLGNEVVALRQSLSWRMTSPLRRVYVWMGLAR